MNYPSINPDSPLALDTETTGVHWPVDHWFGFSWAQMRDGKVVSDYYDIRRNPTAAIWLQDVVNSHNADIVFHNASFDWKMLLSGGVTVPLHLVRDTVIMACIVNEHERSFQLDDLGKKYIGRRKNTNIYEEMARLFGGLPTRNVQIGRISQAPPEVVRPYGRDDAEITIELYHCFLDRIYADGLVPVYEFENDKIPTFIRNSAQGIRVDSEYAIRAADQLKPIIDEAQMRLNNLAGGDINVNSSPQIKKMFDPKQGSDGDWYVGDFRIGKTPKGGPSLGAEYLREMDDPRAELIREIRSTIKTRDTFLLGHVVGHEYNGRVYPTINQMKGEDGGTSTGRLSYQDPAMQQIPSRNKKVAAIVKPCFLPDEDQVWVDADMASFEVRAFLHLLNNTRVNELYAADPFQDSHQLVADLTNLVRNAEFPGQPNAKQLNLSMIFNQGNGATAMKMGMPWHWEEFTARNGDLVRYMKAGPEAMAVIDQYHRMMPGVKELASKCKSVAEKRGWVDTAIGRRLRFPHGYKSYKASGLLIQATSADWNKQNWKIVEEELDGVGRLILNTHDSYSMSLPVDWKPHYERVANRIQGMKRSRIPLVLELSGAGNNWWNALQGELNEAS